MKTNKLFTSNKSQAVRIPKALAFDESVKEVIISRFDGGILIRPIDAPWNDFFDQGPCLDLMAEGREQPEQQERESF